VLTVFGFGANSTDVDWLVIEEISDFQAGATTIVSHEIDVVSCCCFPLQPQVNPRALVVFFTEAFHVAPPRPKRARVHVKRNVRPRRPPRPLRRLAHEAVRPSFRFSRAAKDRDKARFHCWRFFVTGGAPLDPRGVHVRPPPTHRARRIITDAPQ